MGMKTGPENKIKKKVRSRVLLRDTLTGVERWHENEYPYFEYLWEYGNNSCDCNRFMYLYPDSEEEFPCNVGENRFVMVRWEGEKTE